jgi:glycosyltransferase involved in cell wall biosynthesis
LGLAGLFYAKSLKLPLIASYHTHLPQYLQHYGLGFLENAMWELIKTAHNNAELNLCTSTAMVDQLREHGVKEVDLWQRGVDTELFHPQYKSAQMRSRLSGQSRSNLTVVCGQAIGRKRNRPDFARVASNPQ